MPENEKKALEVIVSFVKKHEILTRALTMFVSSHSVALMKTMPKCKSSHCDNPATVVHVGDPERHLCDRCCAEAICEARRGFKDIFQPQSDSQELSWIDLPLASEIRKICAHGELCVELDAEVH